MTYKTKFLTVVPMISILIMVIIVTKVPTMYYMITPPFTVTIPK